jgi:cysteinyl-tRNA synthetase
MIPGNVRYYLLLITLFLSTLTACNKPDVPGLNYRNEMRTFIINLSEYAKERNSAFIIIPQNGQELLTHDGELNGILYQNYLRAIEATAREDLFFGYENDNTATPKDITDRWVDFCLFYESAGVEALVIDYCSSKENVDLSYAENYKNGFISFAAPERNLDVIPSYPSNPFNENGGTINNIYSVQNFLYLINSENFETKEQFIKAISSTYFDLVIIDLFHFEEAYTIEEISLLQKKPNGNRRLVVCYMSIGEAEDYRYYWNDEWKQNPPIWLGSENPNWEGNYKVEYWNADWQHIIYGTTDSYLDKILSSGFDGVWLDLVDAYEYYE